MRLGSLFRCSKIKYRHIFQTMTFDNQHIIRFSSIDSTNNQAWRMIQDGIELDGYVIQSAYQASGKGQMGASWQSEAERNLLLSYVFRPSMVEPSNQFMITKAVSLAVRQAMESIIPGHLFWIKWPNDLYTSGKKAGGILIECSIQGYNIDCCVAGIGLNINQTSFSSDAPNPTSCKLLSGKDHNLDHCQKLLTNEMNSWMSLLKHRQFKHIDEAYLKYLLGYNQPMSFLEMKHNKRFWARITGVNKFGQLLLETEGQVRTFDMKEISLILDS